MSIYTFATQTMIVFEYLSNGDLRNYLMKMKPMLVKLRIDNTLLKLKINNTRHYISQILYLFCVHVPVYYLLCTAQKSTIIIMILL